MAVYELTRDVDSIYSMRVAVDSHQRLDLTIKELHDVVGVDEPGDLDQPRLFGNTELWEAKWMHSSHLEQSVEPDDEVTQACETVALEVVWSEVCFEALVLDQSYTEYLGSVHLKQPKTTNALRVYRRQEPLFSQEVVELLLAEASGVRSFCVSGV